MMRLAILLFLITFTISSCFEQNQSNVTIVNSKLQDMFDKENVTGSILLYNPTRKTYYTNSVEEANKGHIPASTYKIPHTLIGIETGNLTAETVFKWDSIPRQSYWDKDMGLAEAMKVSCVPCYQQLAKKIGVDTMRHYLDKLEYGTMNVNENNLTSFWLMGSSEITPIQQLDFLIKFFNQQLPVHSKTIEITQNIIKSKSFHKDFIMYSKTGLSIDGEPNAWKVGYLIKNEAPFYFAVNITDKRNVDNRDKISRLQKLRNSLIKDAMLEIGIIN